MRPRPPISTLFPYTTLFRSVEAQIIERDGETLDDGTYEALPNPTRDELKRTGQAVRLVGRVAGEQLVATVPRKRDGHRAPREAREQEGGEERRVAERFVEELGKPRHEVERCARA